MAALDAAIHATPSGVRLVLRKMRQFQIITLAAGVAPVFSSLRSVDGRDKPGHDDRETQWRKANHKSLYVPEKRKTS
jgi:hypothetical protein